MEEALRFVIGHIPINGQDEWPQGHHQAHERLGADRSRRSHANVASGQHVHARATWMLGQRGDVFAREVTLVDRTQSPRASLTIGNDRGSCLLLLDQQSKGLAGLTVFADGRPSLGLLDAQGQSRVVLTLESDGTPMARPLDAQGQIIWSASSGPEASPDDGVTPTPYGAATDHPAERRELDASRPSGPLPSPPERPLRPPHPRVRRSTAR